MYQNKIAVAIKSDGKVLREFKDTVYLKFGSEYAICIKNLNTVRVIANIFIDNENIIPGGLVLNAGQTVDLERFVKNNNLNEGSKLKFIERTQNIEQHRGIKLEDGLVRVEYKFEVPRPATTTLQGGWLHDPIKFRYTGGGSTPIMGSSGAISDNMNVNGMLRSADYSKGETMKAQASVAITDYCATNNISLSNCEVHDGAATMDCAVYNDAGITVPGSRSTQTFTTVTMNELEAEKHTIILKLLGETPNNVPVLESVTVKTMQECPTCGTKNKTSVKFCGECGTGLTVY